MVKPINIDGVLVPVCPHCQVPGVLRMRGPWRTWECPQPGCDARVGVHKGSLRAAPLGTMARGPLRGLRMLVHDAFDPLWRGPSPLFGSRSDAYAWLAEALGIPSARCHVGEFDGARCHKALAAICALRQSSSGLDTPAT